MKPLLIIGHTFPEPTTTGAGNRMMQLIDLFLAQGYNITFASTASPSDKSADLKGKGVKTRSILLNDISFDHFVRELKPEVVIFDRYITEEQFGWRVTDNCPGALKVLDTEDLHFLRKAREQAIKINQPAAEANLYTDIAKREISSILRCDLSLIISEFEMRLLQETFYINSEILFYLPFVYHEEYSSVANPSFSERANFVTVGNLLHEPNVDAVFQLKKLWPEIKKQIPEAEIHIYGGYVPEDIKALNSAEEGFFIKGWSNSLKNILACSRVLLAPLRFGAGLKGKLLDAMRFGTPSVTTIIGAEGINAELTYAGSISKNDDEFIKAAILLYKDEEVWLTAQECGFEILRNRFHADLFKEGFIDKIYWLSQNLEKHRKANFLGQILQHNFHQASKYMSRWIEAKNALPHNSSPVCFANSDEIRQEYRD